METFLYLLLKFTFDAYIFKQLRYNQTMKPHVYAQYIWIFVVYLQGHGMIVERYPQKWEAQWMMLIVI